MTILAASRSSLKRFYDSCRQPIPSAALALLIMLSIITVSLIIDSESANTIYPHLGISHWKELGPFLGIFIAGGLFGALCFGIVTPGWRESSGAFLVPLKSTSIPVFFVGIAVFSFFVWWKSAAISSKPGEPLHLLQHDPGGLFAAFMGVVTIVGFAFTLHDLREMRRRITTFPDLIYRLTLMLKKVSRDDTIRMMAYTPALGYIALEDSAFKEFSNALLTPKSPEPRAEMICLNRKDLTDWHNQFVGRKTKRKHIDSDNSLSDRSRVKSSKVTQKLAQAASDKGEHIIKTLGGEAANDDALEVAVKRLPFEFLPGYYFFLSSERAIVVAPLQLPFPKGAPRSVQENLHGTVQMLGFETNDQAIISNLGELYESYKELPSSYVAEHRNTVSAANLESWCQDQANCSAAMTELLRQFNVARAPKERAQSLNEEERVLNQDYAKYFSAEALKVKNVTVEVTFRIALKEEG